ncbi:polyprotein [Phytophthora megakarya]|uniref:Polyprotein n=1 Tax=Phytophthora megakarya TaxID=4795 RepID=A0A225WG85_9STRA|nr:polyprotein [Phytophthora megakarya]
MGMMFKLDNVIYGLKQKDNAWHKTIHHVFMNIGFSADQFIYVSGINGQYVYVSLCVDDLIITAKNHKKINEARITLKN